MATRKTDSAAEQVLHPLLTQGNDVAPITRGELKTILYDLLDKLAVSDQRKSAERVAK